MKKQLVLKAGKSHAEHSIDPHDIASIKRKGDELKVEIGFLQEAKDPITFEFDSVEELQAFIDATASEMYRLRCEP